MDQNTTRLSEAIARSIDPDKVRTIIQLASEQREGIDRDASLVMTGVALGVDETVSRFSPRTGQYIEFMGKTIQFIDTALDEYTGTPAADTLAELRKLLAPELAKLVEEVQQAFAAQVYSGLGIGAEIIFGPLEAAEYADLDLLGLGAEVARRHPSAILGWHRGRSKGHPAGMTCKCLRCYARMWDSLGESEELGLRQMIVDSESLDSAYKDFAIYMIGILREEGRAALKGLPSLHDINPEESKEQYTNLLARVQRASE
jgi:hypothetical protein